MDDHNKNFYLNLLKDIVKTDNGYCLQKTYEEDENGKLKKTVEYATNPNQNEFIKSCARCTNYIYCGHFGNCTIRTALENCQKNSFIPSNWVANCDAYDPIYPLNIIKSETEMINFIDKVQNFFGCPEEYESYFGFERKWDEDTGDILEEVKEYYTRGGKFENIPNKYPCVIYFGVADFDGMRGRNEKLEWIYI